MMKLIIKIVASKDINEKTYDCNMLPDLGADDRLAQSNKGSQQVTI